MKEGKKVVGKQLPPDSVWMFWENKTRGRVPNDNLKCNERLSKEREQMLKNLEDDGKKAKTVQKKKLQEECARMMTRLVVDWEMEKHQEEEAVFKKLEETEKKDLCSSDDGDYLRG